jgi:hypothetical protein
MYVYLNINISYLSVRTVCVSGWTKNTSTTTLGRREGDILKMTNDITPEKKHNTATISV